MLIDLVQFSFQYVLHNVLANVSRNLEYTLNLVLKIETGCCVSVESYKILMKSLRLLHISVRKGYFLRKRRTGGVYASCIFFPFLEQRHAKEGGCSWLCKG